MKYKAFTLAEVLITLSIIGVIAALTVPSLVANSQEKQTVVQLKKAYYSLSQGYEVAKNLYGPAESWDWGKINGPGTEGKATEDILDKFSSGLNLIKKCIFPSSVFGCFAPKTIYKNLEGKDYSYLDQWATSKGLMADGMSILLWSTNNQCQDGLCGYIIVDINGFRGPNQGGRDTFRFLITSKAILPAGLPQNDPTMAECRTSMTGWGCTAWVLQKENLDYPPAGIGWE